jgi:hypothetical protein
MRLVSLLLLALFLLTFPWAGLASPIAVQYQGSILEGAPGVDQGLPVCLSQSPNNVRFKFFVPDFASLTAINGLTISVDVYSPESNNYENGALLFVLNGAGLPNITVQTFSGLFGYTDVAPLTVSGSLSGGDLASALLEIQNDGVFFIRVNRDGNNRYGNTFVVTNPQVSLDADSSVPEPATLGLMGAALMAGFVGIKRRGWR